MKTLKQIIRNVEISLVTYTRSLELCARMNYETENFDFIDAIPKESVFYDLGSCEGRFAIYAALKGLKVFALEPEKDNFNTMIENIQINPLCGKNISVFNLGVGDIDKIATMKIGQPWAGGHQKIVQHEQTRSDLDFDFQQQQQISIVSLDSFIDQNKIPQPNFMKIDIDGSEVPFIMGASKTLSSSILKKIIFELNKKDVSYNFITEKLYQFGFSFETEYQVPNEPDLYNIIFTK